VLRSFDRAAYCEGDVSFVVGSTRGPSCPGLDWLLKLDKSYNRLALRTFWPPKQSLVVDTDSLETWISSHDDFEIALEDIRVKPTHSRAIARAKQIS